jgi:chromosome segregation ATPase
MFGLSGNVNLNLGGLDVNGGVGNLIGGTLFGGGSSNTNTNNNIKPTTNTTTNTTTTTTTTSSYELKLKEQYDVKINNYELKLKEQNNLILRYDQAVKTYDAKLKEVNDQFNKFKLELTDKYDNLLKNRNLILQERDSLNFQIDGLRKENFQFKQTISNYDVTIATLNDKIRFFENENNMRSDRMKEMESKLIAANSQINQSLSLDISQEEQLRKQRETIISLTNQLERIKIEDAAEDIKFAEMEAIIKARNEEIALYKKQIEDLNDKLLMADTCSNVETTEVYLQLQGRYNDIAAERDQLNLQLTIKTNTIKDLDNKVNSLYQKINSLTRTIEEQKAIIEGSETRELQFKNQISQYEININAISRDSAQKDNKIASYENVIKSKDIKINQLTDLIKNRDGKIADYEKKIQEGNSAVSDLREQLEKRLKEIAEWKAEDARDNAQIAELIKNVQDQNETIKKWESENERDDARIAELERLVEEKEANIGKLKQFIFDFRSKFINVRNSAFSLEIADQSLIQERVSTVTTNITNSEQYKTLESNITIKEQEISRLREDVNHYREEVNKAIAEKNTVLAQVESLKNELETEKQSIVHYNTRISEYERRITEYSQKIETETTTTLVAHSRVDNFKQSINAATEEVDALFKEIETILA